MGKAAVITVLARANTVSSYIHRHVIYAHFSMYSKKQRTDQKTSSKKTVISKKSHPFDDEDSLNKETIV